MESHALPLTSVLLLSAKNNLQTLPEEPPLKDFRQALCGTMVFAVEDEALVLMTLEDCLEELGCQVVARASLLDEAILCSRTVQCDVAVLDINLAGRLVTPVADLLAGRGIPFFFTSGYGSAPLPPVHADRLILAKPYRADQIQRALCSTIGVPGG